MSERLQRSRKELADFLRSRREQLSPAEVGLPSGTRRRTPGLRREEVAALAGVGLTWYTWLEQGREIGTSATFLDNLARVLKLDAAERRYLYLLCQARPPAEPGKTHCILPPVIRRLLGDLDTAHRPAFVLNLRWDVLGSNRCANQLLHFDTHAPSERNLLWLLFANSEIRQRLHPWESHARRLLTHFRHDFARATQEPDILNLVKTLEKTAPEFAHLWAQADMPIRTDTPYRLHLAHGVKRYAVSALTIDEQRHLRLVYALPLGRQDMRKE